MVISKVVLTPPETSSAMVQLVSNGMKQGDVVLSKEEYNRLCAWLKNHAEILTSKKINCDPYMF